MDVMHKSSPKRADTESQRSSRNEPSRSHDFAEEIGGNLENDVADEENGQG